MGLYRPLDHFLYYGRLRAKSSFSKAGADVTLALTGISSSVSPGTLTDAISDPITGISASVSPGTITDAISEPITGISGSLSAGAISDVISDPITGISASVSAGTLTDAISESFTGISSTTSPGTLTNAVSFALTGNSSSLSAGNLTSATAYALTSSATTLVPGNVSASGDQTAALTGQAVTSSPGTLKNNVSYALTGAGITVSAGTIADSIAYGLTGNVISLSPGSLTVQADQTAALTGQSVTTNPGTLTNNVTYALTGSAITSSAGTLSNVVSFPLTGNAISLSPGSLAVIGGSALVHHWKLDEGSGTTAIDSIAGNNATITNGSYVTGQIGEAVSLPGSGSVITTASTVNFSSLGSFTVSLWINPRSFTNGLFTDANGTYFVDRFIDTPGIASLKAVNGKYGFQFRYDDGSGLSGINTTNGIVTDTWVNIIYGRSFNNKFFICFNGLEQATATDSGSKALSPQRYLFGNHQTGTKPLDGVLDDIKIWNYALSAAEIAQIYQDGQSTVRKRAVPPKRFRVRTKDDQIIWVDEQQLRAIVQSDNLRFDKKPVKKRPEVIAKQQLLYSEPVVVENVDFGVYYNAADSKTHNRINEFIRQLILENADVRKRQEEKQRQETDARQKRLLRDRAAITLLLVA